MKNQIEVTTVRNHVICPGCNKPAGTVDHLKGTDISTAWYCEHCGVQYSFKLSAGGTVSDVAATGSRCVKNLVLLVNGSIGLVIEGSSLAGDDQGQAYFYNQHTCPINYMPSVKAVFDLKANDTDPHGIFSYVTTIPWDAKIEDCHNSEYLATLLALFNSDAQSFSE